MVGVEDAERGVARARHVPGRVEHAVEDHTAVELGRQRPSHGEQPPHPALVGVYRRGGTGSARRCVPSGSSRCRSRRAGRELFTPACRTRPPHITPTPPSRARPALIIHYRPGRRSTSTAREAAATRRRCGLIADRRAARRILFTSALGPAVGQSDREHRRGRRCDGEAEAGSGRGRSRGRRAPTGARRCAAASSTRRSRAPSSAFTTGISAGARRTASTWHHDNVVVTADVRRPDASPSSRSRRRRTPMPWRACGRRSRA